MALHENHNYTFHAFIYENLFLQSEGLFDFTGKNIVSDTLDLEALHISTMHWKTYYLEVLFQ